MIGVLGGSLLGVEGLVTCMGLFRQILLGVDDMCRSVTITLLIIDGKPDLVSWVPLELVPPPGSVSLEAVSWASRGWLPAWDYLDKYCWLSTICVEHNHHIFHH